MEPHTTAPAHRSGATVLPVPATERDDVLVIVPTYQEAATIGRIVAAVRSVGMGVLVVDDGSPDGTAEIVAAVAGRDPRVGVLRRPGKGGLGPAYAAGFAAGLAAGAGILCEMDADLSHDPADLPRLVAAIDAGADLAIGSRYVPGGRTEGWPVHRRWISRAGNAYARTLLRLPVADATAGFRAYRATALRRLRPGTCEASGYGFQIEMVWRAVAAGLEIREVPIVFRERTSGYSKMSTGIALEAMRLVTRWALGRPPIPTRT